MSRRFQLALLPAVLAAVLTAVPVSAAKTPVRLTEAAGQFPDRAFILTLPTARPLAASQVQVRENGQRVSDLVVTPAAASDPNQFGVVLVLDASNSMKGEAIAGAIHAAQLFVGHRAPAQKVAVVTFNNAPAGGSSLYGRLRKDLAGAGPSAGARVRDAYLRCSGRGHLASSRCEHHRGLDRGSLGRWRHGQQDDSRRSHEEGQEGPHSCLRSRAALARFPPGVATRPGEQAPLGAFPRRRPRTTSRASTTNWAPSCPMSISCVIGRSSRSARRFGYRFRSTGFRPPCKAATRHRRFRHPASPRTTERSATASGRRPSR